MKFYRTIILTMALTLAVSLNAKTYCLFSGVSNYPGESADLKSSTDDVKRLAAFYDQYKGFVVMPMTGKHATSTKILAYIDTIAKRVTPEDNVVFCFSGHGLPNRLVTYDMSRGLYYYDLFEALRKLNCAKVLVYIDACFSGSAFATKGKDGLTEYLNRSFAENEGNNEKFIIFSSSRNNETSLENSELKAGLFTNALLLGLNGGADANKDSKITTMELFNYIWYDLKERLEYFKNKQHPNLTTSSKNHDVVLLDLDTPKKKRKQQ